jgi:hypothetical protein
MIALTGTVRYGTDTPRTILRYFRYRVPVLLLVPTALLLPVLPVQVVPIPVRTVSVFLLVSSIFLIHRLPLLVPVHTRLHVLYCLSKQFFNTPQRSPSLINFSFGKCDKNIFIFTFFIHVSNATFIFQHFILHHI